MNFNDETGRKSSNVWVDNGRDFAHMSMKSCLQEHDIKFTSQNEGKFDFTERFVRTLKINFLNI